MRLVWEAFLTGVVVVLLSLQIGCAGTVAEPSANSSNSPVNTAQLVSLSPTSIAAGHAGFLLTASGLNFSSASVILWNGAEIKTDFVSSDELTAQIPASSLVQSSVISVAVKNLQSGAISNALSLTLGDPLSIATTALPDGIAGRPYAAPVSVSGGIPPFHWSMTSGNLPPGLAMDSQSGTISGMATEPGTSEVGLRVTDSVDSSAQANLAIQISETTQPSGLTITSSYGFYGSGIGADRLANTALGPNANMVSYRFRAKHSGSVPQVLIYLIPDHPGYAGGTGGKISVTLHTDDTTTLHNPSSTVLASSVISNILALPSPSRYFYTVKFAAAPTLSAGQLYHLVFKNIDASPTVNFLSVDDLYAPNSSTAVQGAIGTSDAAVLLSQEGGAWQSRVGYTPVYQLDFSNGITEGVGYIEGWSGAPRAISGTYAVRERFTVSGSDVKVSAVAIRIARLRGNNPLVVRLENANGSLIEEGSIPATAIPLSSSTSPSYFWAHLPLATTYTLVPGDTYHLDLEATSTSTYQAFPIRKGLYYGFKTPTFFHDGHAEFEQNYSWYGWTQWGTANRTDGDLQFYFSIAP